MKIRISQSYTGDLKAMREHLHLLNHHTRMCTLFKYMLDESVNVLLPCFTRWIWS